MPTLLIWRGHKFRFYSSDIGEPPHVHVVKDGSTAKIWLNGVVLAYSRGYSEQELTRILAVVAEHRESWTQSWRDFFGV